jgi:hypothetical protein
LPKKLMDEWKGVDPEAHPPPNSSSIGLGTSDDPAPLVSAIRDGTLNANDIARGTSLVSSNKRKADDSGSGRAAKRSNHMRDITRCVSTHSRPFLIFHNFLMKSELIFAISASAARVTRAAG